MKKLFFIMSLYFFIAFTMFAGKGYEKSFQIDSKFGLGDFNQSYNVGITMTNGYRINSYLMLGANVGILCSKYVWADYYDAILYDFKYISSENRFERSYIIMGEDVRQKKGLLIPLSAIAKFNFLKGRISPYLSTNIGYMFNVKEYSKEKSYGMFLMPSLGIDIKFSRANIFLQLNFDAQKSSYIDYYNEILKYATMDNIIKIDNIYDINIEGILKDVWFKSIGVSFGCKF